MATFKKSFYVTVELKVEDSLIGGVLTDEWRSSYYNLTTPDQVASHLAYNVVANAVDDVSKLDGFADRKKSDMEIVRVEWEEEV